jgi:hypothetical protein
MVLAGLKAVVAGAVQDRAAVAGVVVVAAFLLMTGWVLGVAGVVVLLVPHLGTAGALFAVTAGLVVLALGSVWVTVARNRRHSRVRAETRALWVATAVNAAGLLLRRGPDAAAAADPAAGSSGNHRSALLIAGGLALILLALLLPSGKGEGDDPPDIGPDEAA